MNYEYMATGSGPGSDILTDATSRKDASGNAILCSNVSVMNLIGTTPLSSGVVYVCRVNALVAFTIARLSVYIPATVGSGFTANESFIGAYSSGGVLLGQSADQAGVWNALGLRTSALTVQGGQSLAISQGSFFYAGVLVNATTRPVFATSGLVSNVNLGVTGVGPVTYTTYTGYITGGGATVLPTTLGTLTGGTGAIGPFWVGVS